MSQAKDAVNDSACENCGHTDPHDQSSAGGGESDPFDACSRDGCECGYDSRATHVYVVLVDDTPPGRCRDKEVLGVFATRDAALAAGREYMSGHYNRTFSSCAWLVQRP